MRSSLLPVDSRTHTEREEIERIHANGITRTKLNKLMNIEYLRTFTTFLGNDLKSNEEQSGAQQSRGHSVYTICWSMTMAQPYPRTVVGDCELWCAFDSELNFMCVRIKIEPGVCFETSCPFVSAKSLGYRHTHLWLVSSWQKKTKQTKMASPLSLLLGWMFDLEIRVVVWRRPLRSIFKVI